MSDPILIEAPAQLLTVSEVKVHLRLDHDHDHEDLLIRVLIDVAVGWMDGWQGVLGRCILRQTWAIKAGALASMALPFPDPQSAVVSYLDAAGASQTVDPSAFRVRTVRGAGQLVFAETFTAPPLLAGRDDAVTVTAVYGRDAAPAPLKVAVLMLVGHWYRNREAVVTGTTTAEVPMAVQSLIAPFRVGLV
jgi:uncharacterized phiE125 gp8 family phage protein